MPLDSRSGAESRRETDSTFERLAKLEVLLPNIQMQLEENNRQLVEVQKDIARINVKMSLIVWLGSGIGVIFAGVAGRLFVRSKSAA